MNKKYLIIILILQFFFFSHFLGNTCCFDSPLFHTSAWGEEPVTTSEKWQKLIEVSASQQIADEDLGHILGVARRAEAAGFPVEPFLDKALEGMAKSVSPPVITQVLEKKLDHFRMCQKILQKMPETEKEPVFRKKQALTILAESISRGVSETELEELGRQAPKPQSINLANASEALATLKNQNISSDDAMEIVQYGLKYGLYKQRNPELSLTIRQARRRGISPQELKNHLISNIRQGRGIQGILRGRPNQGQVNQQSKGKGKGNTFKGGASGGSSGGGSSRPHQ